MSNREISRIITGSPTRDGAGVELTRVIGSSVLDRLDPFLLLDRFGSDEPRDYIAGFPPHPHRGFETVTYLLAGRMRHRDSAGHEGVIEPGGVQWMTAGKGVIHSEMPEQENGLLGGFQLWVNLPAAHKMDEPTYQEFDASRIPVESRDGAELKVIAGTTQRGTRGPVDQPLTAPLYLDITLAADTRFDEPVEEGHNGFIYIESGAVEIEGTTVRANELGILQQGDRVSLRSGADGARLLLIAGRPIQEPVARGGPFVMNTRQEIIEAFTDYEAGRLAPELS